MSSGDHFDDTPGSLARLRALLIRFPAIGQQLRLRRKVLRGFDLPYLAGSSWDGRTIYIDQHLPMLVNGIPITQFLEVHESVERALQIASRRDPALADYRSYEACHHLATAAECYAVISAGYDWKTYRDGLHPDYAPIEGEHIHRVPPDLMLYPYSGKLLVRMRECAEKTKFTQEEVNYRPATSESRECEGCWKFLPRTGRCLRVAGSISPEGVCDKWEREKANG